jgi:hypothetical protein
VLELLPRPNLHTHDNVLYHAYKTLYNSVMKIVRNGIMYDTDTATLIASIGHEHWGSDGWAGLYRTPDGAFFEMVVDHDGSTILKLGMLDRNQARAFVEKHANDQVEKYFGVMPTPQAPRFSRPTVLAAIDLLGRMSHSDITRYLLELGPDIRKRVPDETSSRAKRLLDLASIIDESRERRLPTNEYLQDNVVDKAIQRLPKPNGYSGVSEFDDLEAALVRALSLDGYTYRDGELRRALPQVVDVTVAEDDIFTLLCKHRFHVAEGHLRQAYSAHTKGDWAAANSQVRVFFESLLDEVAVAIDSANASLPSSHARRSKLAVEGFLYQRLNEWSEDGKGFINGLVRRLHPEGAHPGLSDSEDSTFRLQIVLITARLLLVRYDSGQQP